MKRVKRGVVISLLLSVIWLLGRVSQKKSDNIAITRVAQPASMQKMSELDRYQLIVTRAHVPLFGVENIFTTSLGHQELKNWYFAVKIVSNYVKKKARNDKILLKALVTILKTNNDFINSLKVMYNAFLSKPDKIGGSDVLRLDYILHLNDLEQKMKSVQSTLRNTSFYFTRKKDASKILQVLALTLELSINAAIMHFSKELQKRREREAEFVKPQPLTSDLLLEQQ